jgi:transcriptional regulator with XRE-family HTH domain
MDRQVEDIEIGPYLRSVRDALHMTTRDVEDRSRRDGGKPSVTASQVNRIENGGTPNPGFQTLQNIVAALGIPVVVVLDGSQTNVDRVTILSSQEFSQSLPQALQRPELMELLIYCQELTDEQIQAILSIARSIRGFTRIINQPEAPKE